MFDEFGLERLNEAVILQAARDYVMACKCGDKRTKRECEKLFKSDWFNAFSKLDGNVLLAMLQDEVEHDR